MRAAVIANGAMSWNAAAVALLIAAITVTMSLPHHFISVFDSGDYLRCAVQLNAGIWNLKNDFYAARLAAFIPYAAGIALFGYGEWLTYITLAELLLLLLLVYALLSPYSKPVAIIAVVILSTSQAVLRSSTVVMGDILVTLTSNTVILLYLFFFLKENKTLSSAGKMGVLAAITFIISFWTKESVIFYVPLMIYMGISDRKDIFLKEFWKYAFSGVFLMGIITLIVYAVKTGNPLFRIFFLEHQAATTDIDYDAASRYAIFLRCTVQPFQFLMLDYTYGALFLLSVLHVAQPVKSPVQGKLKAYFILTLAAWWLGSQSLFTWNPMALTHRLWLPLIVPLAINGASGACYFIQNQAYSKKEKLIYTLTVISFLVAAYISLYVSKADYEKLGAPATGLFLTTLAFTVTAAVLLGLIHVRWLSLKNHLARIALVGAIVLPQLGWQMITLHRWIKNEQPGEYRDEKEMVEEVRKSEPSLVLADAGLSRNYGIYDGFQQPLPFAFYIDIPYDSLHEGTYLLINKTRLKDNAVNMVEALAFARSQNTIPEFVLHPQRYDFRLVKENSTDRLFILQR